MSGFSNGIVLPNVGATGPPTTGSHAKNELWADSAGALWVCTVGGLPGTWVDVSAPSGTVLATKLYAPGSRTVINLTTSLAAIDTTNATLAFTVPASGRVDVDVECLVSSAQTVNVAAVTLALLNHSGGAQVGNSKVGLSTSGAAGENVVGLVRSLFHLTGLAPGPFQVDLAAGVNNAVGSAGIIIVQGITGLYTPSVASELIIRATAA